MADFSKDLNTSSHSEEQNPLLERFAYLYREANMLTRVIEYVPYDENPPGKPSTLELLEDLRRIQVDYLLPLIQKTQQSGSVEIQSVNAFYEELDRTSSDKKEVYEVLGEIEKKRKEALQQLKKADPQIWKRRIIYENREESFRKAVERIIDFERSVLSDISDQVLNYSQQKSTQRQIRQRRNQRNNPSSK